MRSLLSITIIHEFPNISIDFVLCLTKSYLDVDVFMELHLGVVVDGNRVEWVTNLNK